jgi:type I restriction enzyme R subunit
VVQGPLVKYAIEAGWTFLSPEQALSLRHGEMSAVLHDVLVQRLQALNPRVMDAPLAEAVVKRLAQVQPTIEGNLVAWEYLTGLRTVYVETQRRERDVRLLDPDMVDANSFHVTPEFVYTNGVKTIRADVVLLVNGLPVLIIETKAAIKFAGIAEALDHVRRYHRETPELLALLQLYTLSDLHHFLYGATWALGRKEACDWRDEQTGDFETLVKSFVSPARVLRVLTDFILFPRKDGELSKVVLRPHQMRAVERVLQRAREAEKLRGLIWHTQGSGKTYTMLTVAKQLIADPAFDNPTVLMLVDRNELEAQLFGNLQAVGFGSAVVAQSKPHMRHLLAQDRRGLIVSMIHKFDDVPPRLNTRANIFVLVDEAHRTTGGDLGNYLMAALPNATYVGFTGTPIDRTSQGKGTFKVFGGDDAQGYLDKYSIRESIEDGTTVPLHYALAPHQLLVDRETLEREFLNVAELEGVSDVEELNRVLSRAVVLSSLLKNPDRIRQVAEHVVAHFRANVEPMGYKALLVAVDREACARYKAELDRHMLPEESAVIISTEHDDPPLLARLGKTEDQERDLRDAFRKPAKLPKILIVTEKLLTGFDAPILYCMYLDKPMRDHILLQAIARVNRPYEDDQGRRKIAGFILDYIGIFDRLERALAFDVQDVHDVRAVIQDLAVLRYDFAQRITTAQTAYLGLGTGLIGDKQAEAILEHFRDEERRQTFYQDMRELQEIYEILSPDAFLGDHMPAYQELLAHYHLVRAAFEPYVEIDRSFLHKTAELAATYTHTDVIQNPTAPVHLTPDAIERIASADQPEGIKVFNLLKALQNLATELGKQAPHLIPIGERAEQIARDFHDRQITTQEALRELEGLIKEYREADTDRQHSALSTEGFAVAWLLKRQGVTMADVIATHAADAFMGHPHWISSPEQERHVRMTLYRELHKAKVPVDQAVAIVDGLLSTLRRAASP